MASSAGSPPRRWEAASTSSFFSAATVPVACLPHQISPIPPYRRSVLTAIDDLAVSNSSEFPPPPSPLHLSAGDLSRLDEISLEDLGGQVDDLDATQAPADESVFNATMTEEV